jgi:COP9 signalosome complex subunit 7
MSELKQSGNPLEQFVLLSKSAHGAGAVELIKQALEAPGVYVFGELLDMPNIEELKTGSSESYYNLLNVFAFGSYPDFKENQANLPELTPVMLKKLKHLSIVSLATKSKCIPYATLLKELDINNVRELEDLIIEAIYADIIHGKLDQERQQVEIDYVIGRDIRPEAFSEIITVLGEWCTSCEAVLGGIETQITRANTYKEKQNTIKTQIETEVSNIKKTLKTSQQQEVEEQMVTDSRDMSSSQEKPTKKSSKTKGLRGSGKFWGKSS